MPADEDGHLLVAYGLEVLLQLDEAVARDREDDDQRRERPRDLEARVAVDLGWHVAGRLARAPVAQHDPEEGEFDADVGVVDRPSIRRYRVGKDGVEAAAQIACAEQQSEGGQTTDGQERPDASSHEVEVYRRPIFQPRYVTLAAGLAPAATRVPLCCL